jgi:hypothetical protein
MDEQPTLEQRVLILEALLNEAFGLIALAAEHHGILARDFYNHIDPDFERKFAAYQEQLAGPKVPTEQPLPPAPALPEDGFLDCESYVAGRMGILDMRIANQFGQACARAAQARGISPKKITHPGEHWREVNTWPVEFLREMWFLSYGGAN